MRVAVCVLGLIACEGEEPVEYPDITGRYQVVIGGSAGCDGDASLLTEWANGPLQVTGEATSLVFDFGDGIEMVGSVSEAGAYQFGATFERDGVWFAAAGGGVATPIGAGWALDGSVSAEVDDDELESNNCTIEGPYQATWIGEG